MSSSILGILISLHDNKIECLYIRVAFLIAILFLAVGILSLTIMLYDRSMLVEHARQKFAEEARNALQEDRELRSICVPDGKRLKICKIISYTTLPFSLLMLIIYTVLSTFL